VNPPAFRVAWLSFAALALAAPRAQSQTEPVAPVAPATPVAAKRPNVFLITIDTLRADHLGIYGYPRRTSPHLNRFGRENVFFRHPLCQWPKTTPSFASMLTGLHPRTTTIKRICGVEVPDKLVLVAERFQAAGWKTVGVVSNPNLDVGFGFAQGFDDYTEGWKDEQRKRITAEIPGDSPDSYAKFVNLQFFSALDRVGAKEGLFAWVHYSDPHAPYEPPKVYASKFVDDAWYDTTRHATLLPESEGTLSYGGIPVHAALGGRTELAWYLAQYDAEIFATDEQIDILLDGLEKRGLLKDALVIVTSDHGESIGEHDWYCEHGPHPYEDCAKVPLLMKVPGLELPVTVEQPVGLIDLVPTMLSFAGLELDPKLEGVDLLPVIRGVAEPPDHVVTGAGYAEDSMRAIRVGRWKLIHVRDPVERARLTGEEWELYDVDADPKELENLAAARPDVLLALQRRMADWLFHHPMPAQEETGAATPLDPRTEELLRKFGYIK